MGTGCSHPTCLLSGSKFPPKGHANNTIVYFSHDMQRWEADGGEIVPHNVNRNLEENTTHGDRDSVAKKHSK